MQKTRAWVDFFTQHWFTVGTVTGRELGPQLFQFSFETEQYLQSFLRKAPYHFKKWMIILQRWKPSISDDFPAKIPFWIIIHGLPLHFWTDLTLNTIGEELGLVEDRDVDHARVRVLLNGLKPLEMHLNVSLSGSIKKVELEYKKLEKHCFICHRLSHENIDCPSRTNEYADRAATGTISQTRTLDRLEESRRRRDERKRGNEPWNRHGERGRWNLNHREVSSGSARTPPPRMTMTNSHNHSGSLKPSSAAYDIGNREGE